MPALYDTPIKTNAQNLERVLNAGLPVLVSFEIPNCSPCQRLKGNLESLAEKYAGKALIVRVENTRDDDLERKYAIRDVPTLLLWKDGKEIARLVGAVDERVLASFVGYLVQGGQQPPSARGPAISLQIVGEQPGQPSTTASSTRGASYGVGSPVTVTDATFEQEVLRSPTPVLVDFWAPWCGPCRMVSPIVEDLGREYGNRLRVAKVNTDENPRYAGQLGIQGIPTLILFKNGREVDRIVGAAPKTTIQSRVERALSI